MPASVPVPSATSGLLGLATTGLERAEYSACTLSYMGPEAAGPRSVDVPVGLNTPAV